MKDSTEIVSVTTGYKTELPWYDDSYGPLWAYSSDPYGSIGFVVRARSWEDAYEIVIDESPTIPESELPEAYGFYGDTAQADFQKAIDNEDYPDLVEGYQYQSNFTGTGIVEVGHCENLTELTSVYWKRLGLRIKIRRCE